MKRFLKGIALFLVIWLLISSVADIILTKKIRQSPSRAIRVWEDVINGNVNDDIIILGSSRACDHYNPEVIEKLTGMTCYNLGQIGKLIDMDIMRYKVFKTHTKHQPKIIIWDVHYNSLNHSDGWCDAVLTPFLKEEEIWKVVKSGHHEFSILNRTIPLYRYWKKAYIYDYAFNNIQNDANPYKGYICKGGALDSTAASVIGDGEIKCVKDNSIINSFMSTINEMKADGSIVIIVYSPFYYKGIPLVNGIDEISSLYQEIADEAGITYLCFINDPICEKEDYFRDYTHMNSNGADAFSTIIAQYINQHTK